MLHRAAEIERRFYRWQKFVATILGAEMSCDMLQMGTITLMKQQALNTALTQPPAERSLNFSLPFPT